MAHFASFRVRQRLAHLAGALAAVMILAGGTGAHAQSTVAREFIRKATAGEDDNGFCATTGWPVGNAETNRAFRENAAVGSATMDNFANGTCATARVVEVYFNEGRKCLRYTWWACQPGNRCASGTTLTCKSASGNWEDRRS